jgi:hypothetical protein
LLLPAFACQDSKGPASHLLLFRCLL